MPNRLSDDVLQAAVQALREHGNQPRAAAALGISKGRMSERLKEARARGLYIMDGGTVAPFETQVAGIPPRGKVKRYILTCAQNNTKLFKPVWKNLQALAEHYNARVMVSTFKYNKDAQGQRSQSKFETRDAELIAMYPSEILPYVSDDRVDIAPNITWCGELNVLPTAVNPLEGLEQYTYRKSTIVPHPKLALVSVPAMKSEGVKLMLTTGCVTQRNYIKRKVGYKAEHFHSYGALLVEIDDKGSWWCRQLQQGVDESIYDLDVRVKDGKVTKFVPTRTTDTWVEDIAWGDVHGIKVDPEVAAISWGHNKDSMIETLKPRSQHVHDLLDFGANSHHTRKDPHEMFRRHVDGEHGVVKELQQTAHILWHDISRPWCQTFVVNSNHDRHLERWLKEIDWRYDPSNARTILALNLRYLDAIAAGDRKFNLISYALRYVGRPLVADWKEDEDKLVRFLAEDESHIILPEIDGGIEGGLHGDRGANGAKGSISGIGRIDRKVNGADKHTIAIYNGAYFCGASCQLDMRYNHGLSSWSRGHIVTYPNGTRAILSIWKGKWRA